MDEKAVYHIFTSDQLIIGSQAGVYFIQYFNSLAQPLTARTRNLT
jgi:hypothetical protein